MVEFLYYQNHAADQHTAVLTYNTDKVFIEVIEFEEEEKRQNSWTREIKPDNLKQNKTLLILMYTFSHYTMDHKILNTAFNINHCNLNVCHKPVTFADTSL